MKKVVIHIVSLCCLLMCFSCEDHDDFFAYSSEKTQKKIIPGDWEIKKMDVFIIDDVQNWKSLDEFHYENVGTMSFDKDFTMNLSYNNGKVDTDYITLYSQNDVEWSYTGGSIDISTMSGDVIYLDKKEMRITFPYVRNIFLTDRKVIKKAVEIHYTLKKKK